MLNTAAELTIVDGSERITLGVLEQAAGTYAQPPLASSATPLPRRGLRRMVRACGRAIWHHGR